MVMPVWINTWVPLLNFFGMFSLLIGMFFMNFKSGESREANKVIQTYKERISQLEQSMAEMKNNLAELYGQLKVKTEQITSLQSLLIIKNPDMDKFMTTMLSSISNNASLTASVKNYMQKIYMKLRTY